MTIVRVVHSGADYEVVIGPVSAALAKVASLASGSRLPVVSDRRVYDLHGASLAGISLPDSILVPEGEAAKAWGTLASIVNQLAGLGVNRGTPIIALGGGSVGDVAGLAASLFKRGCPIIHVPTTLLAQADSAIGGKTAIDAANQKNLAGTFHHPALVVADPAFLDSLDQRQLRSGYAEVVKYGLIDDPAFFDWCEANGPRLLGGDSAARTHAIEYCVRAKARFVAADPDDTTGGRALLNFGHTFGHAIEALGGDEVLHGEAIAIGMCLAAQFSERLGLCSPEDGQRVRAHLDAVGLPTSLAQGGLEGRSADLLALMAHDKKAGPDGISLVLTRGIGQTFLQRGIDMGRLSDFLENSA